MEPADRIPVIHGIEGCHLVNSHRWHLEYPCYLIHYADASEAMLSLAKVQKWHHCGLLVLAWVSGNDLFDELLILRRELKRNGRIVDRCVSMLIDMLMNGFDCGVCVRKKADYLQP